MLFQAQTEHHIAKPTQERATSLKTKAQLDAKSALSSEKPIPVQSVFYDTGNTNHVNASEDSMKRMNAKSSFASKAPIETRVGPAFGMRYGYSLIHRINY